MDYSVSRRRTLRDQDDRPEELERMRSVIVTIELLIGKPVSGSGCAIGRRWPAQVVTIKPAGMTNN